MVPNSGWWGTISLNVLGKYIESFDIDELRDNKIYEIADKVEVDENGKTIVTISSVSIIKAQAYQTESWMIDYWINKELPKVNAEIVFTEEAEEAIKHLLGSGGFYKFAEYTGDPSQDLQEVLSLLSNDE